MAAERTGLPPRDDALARRAKVLLEERGDAAGAAAIYRDLIRRHPGLAGLHHLLGLALLRLADPAGARRHMARAAQLRPEPLALRDLARMAEAEGDIEGALAILDDAIARFPDAPVLRATRAELWNVLGRHAEAWNEVEPLLTPDAEPSVVLSAARICRRSGQERPVAEALERILARADMPLPRRALALMRLGELLDAAGEYDCAFAAVAEGNRLRALRFEPAVFAHRLEELERVWTREAIDRLPRAEDDSPLPVLIVGMPRSGTTLVEQILDSHPQVRGCGERRELGDLAAELDPGGVSPRVATRLDALTRKGVTRLGRRYLSALRALAGVLPRATDKMPANLLHLGLAQVISPGARAIVCRRDARDTCLSCFFQNFPDALAYTTDLRWLGAACRAQTRLVEHWSRVLTMPTLDVRYEDLVARTEAHARRIVEFIGLPWDEACLRFHESKRVPATASVEQVRRPVYTTSVGRWRHYEGHLAPLVEALGDLA